LHINLSKFDVDSLLSYFEYTMNGVTHHAFKWQVRAVIPGSTAQGAATAVGDLITGEFMVRLVAAAEVATCDGNRLVWDGVTFSDKERETYVYNIPKAGEADLTLELEALKIIPDLPVTDCPIEMIAQVLIDGDWKDVRTNAYMISEMDQAARRFTFQLSQKQYIEEIISRYGSAAMPMNEIPRETSISYRILAWD
jgi:hypothetical protein